MVIAWPLLLIVPPCAIDVDAASPIRNVALAAVPAESVPPLKLTWTLAFSSRVSRASARRRPSAAAQVQDGHIRRAAVDIQLARQRRREELAASADGDGGRLVARPPVGRQTFKPFSVTAEPRPRSGPCRPKY